IVEPARSSLWAGHRSLSRRFEALRLDLDGLHRAAKGLGGTVNDAFVTVMTGAVGAYHRAKGVEVGDLRMSMPVNTRTDRGASGNSFAPTRLMVPAGVVDPAARFQAVRERLDRTKHERAIGLADVLAGLVVNPATVRAGKAHPLRLIDARVRRGVALRPRTPLRWRRGRESSPERSERSERVSGESGGRSPER